MAAPGVHLAVKAAAQALLRQDEDGMPLAVKLSLGAAGGLFFFFILVAAAVLEFLSPFKTHRRPVDFTMPDYYVPKISVVAFPVASNVISSGYGDRKSPIAGKPYLSWHEGIDFPVAFDSPVMAAAPGRVAKTGVSADYGHYVLIWHKLTRYDVDDEVVGTESFYSLYAHLYKVYVFDGQEVGEGQQIGTSGGDPARHFAGSTTAPHLHFELRRTLEYGSHFDPYDYLQDPYPFRGSTAYIGWG